MRILWPVATTKSLDKSDYLTALLQTLLHQRQVHEVGKEWVCRDEHMPARNQDAKRPLGKLGEESPQVRKFFLGQDSESGQRASGTAIKRGRNSPHSAAPLAEFLLLYV